MIHPNDIRIVLSWQQIGDMAIAGCARNVQALAREWKPSKYTKDGWKDNIEGCCGELAVAVWFGDKDWVPIIGNPDAPDVRIYEVRTNGSQRLDDLVLRPQDVEKKADQIFISVLAFPPVFYIAGWIFAYHGMIEKYWGGKTGPRENAWWVPHEKLHPMSTLPSKPRKKSYDPAPPDSADIPQADALDQSKEEAISAPGRGGQTRDQMSGLLPDWRSVRAHHV